MGITVKFTFEKETKNTVRFQEVSPDDTAPTIGTLYLQKAAYAALGEPTELFVTVNDGPPTPSPKPVSAAPRPVKKPA